MIRFYFIQFILIMLALETLIGCSSTPKRTKWSDPVMRIMINPEGIDSNNYVHIQNALVQSGKWFVVDRAEGFKAAVQEQNMTRINAPNRFDDYEKYARLKKLYGVGGVIQAHVQCAVQGKFLRGQVVVCQEYLSIISTNTGEVIASAEGEAEAPENMWWTHMQSGNFGMAPDWKDTVETLNTNFPERFEENKYTPEMKEYKQVIREEAIREQTQSTQHPSE